MFIVEIGTVLNDSAGRRMTVSLVPIFRIRDRRIAMVRDYFAAPGSVG